MQSSVTRSERASRRRLSRREPRRVPHKPHPLRRQQRPVNPAVRPPLRRPVTLLARPDEPTREVVRRRRSYSEGELQVLTRPTRAAPRLRGLRLGWGRPGRRTSFASRTVHTWAIESSKLASVARGKTCIRTNTTTQSPASRNSSTSLVMSPTASRWSSHQAAIAAPPFTAGRRGPGQAG